MNKSNLFTAVLLNLLLCGCSSNQVLPARSIQNDTSPPVFLDLEFPEDNSTIEEGIMIITGTLDDGPEGSFHPETPVFLDINIALESLEEPISFTYYAPEGEPDQPSYFDYSTGDFRLSFDENRRLKPRSVQLRLYGMDASENISDPIVADVRITDIDEGDYQLIYDARSSYGEQLSLLFDPLIKCLGIYGTQYKYDINILNNMKDLIDDTYVSSPSIDTWVTPISDFVSDIQELDYSDPILKLAVDTAADEFQEWYFERLESALFPTYPPSRDNYAKILEGREEFINHFDDYYLIDPLELEEPAIGYRIVLYCRRPLFFEEQEVIADLEIIAHPQYPLEITGYIGTELNRVFISESDYDPPIKLLSVFENTVTGRNILFKMH